MVSTFEKDAITVLGILKTLSIFDLKSTRYTAFGITYCEVSNILQLCLFTHELQSAQEIITHSVRPITVSVLGPTTVAHLQQLISRHLLC